MSASGRDALAFAERWGRRLTEEPLSWIPFLLVSIAAVALAAAALSMRIWYEAQGPYNVDTSVYWTVGRGILAGYTPYLDLFETKPPGIFLLSALSYLVTGQGTLTHASQVGSILVVGLAPLVYLPRVLRARPLVPGLTAFLALYALVLALTTQATDLSCEVQTEIHGLAGAVVYMLLIGSRRRFAFLGRAAGILVAIGLKEPFLLVIPASYWVLSPPEERPFDDLVGPLLLALVTGTLLLLLTGWLSPYVGIHLRSMLAGHLQAHDEGFWSRALSAIDRTWNMMRDHSVVLPPTLLFVAGLYVLSPSRKGEAEFVRRFRNVFLGALLAGVAVGSGGHFYGHQFVFATTLHLALVFAAMATLHASHDLRRVVAPALAVLALVSVVTTKWVAPAEYRAQLEVIQAHDANAREAARVIDEVLDELGVERYLWLGHPGWAPLPFTLHLPLGPLFFQQVMFFERGFSWLSNRFRDRLQDAEVVVFSEHMTGPADRHVKNTLARDFSLVPESHLPRNHFFPYKMFVRRGRPLPALRGGVL